MFEEFWGKYPRKVSKKMAQVAWNKLTAEEKQSALDAIDTHNTYWRIKDTPSEYIPHCATWLNQGRWDDEIDLTIKEQKRPQLPWYSSDELTLAKGNELGIRPYAGESMGNYRQRIHQHLQRSMAS